MSPKKAITAKPKEIIEIEKINKVKLAETRSVNGRGISGNPSYSLDKDGNIVSIDLSNLQIKTLDVISTLNLIEANFTNNLIKDISQLVNKKNLKYLFLGGNRIENIESLKTCTSIQELALWRNPIKDMSPINSLLKLKHLYIQRIGISNIDFLCGLNNLQIIALDENEIEDIDYLKGLKKLPSISLDNNRINKIPIEVAKKYDWLSSALANHERRNGISLLDNPLYYPPKSVIELGSETVQNYYQSAKLFGHAPLSEGRIIVIGDGSAGKSSLIERVLYDSFDPNKTQTNGIKIDHLHLIHTDKRKLVFHIWDFGGQEIQHAVHKFFFTEGCLYLLVLDNRKEEEPEYWLQQIESLGGRAPVMVIFNKQDDNVTEITDRKFLKEKYPNIVGFYSTSCKTGFGIQDFKAALEKQVVKLRTVEEQFPFNWFNIKKSIEACTSGSQHYLDFTTYRNICLQYNVENEKTQKLLLKYLTTIGAVTWFGDTFLNFLHVLSPAWITQGVYKIITARLTDELFGKINISNFPELLKPMSESDYAYEENHYGYILSMMKKFDLCYTPDDRILLIPSAFIKTPNIEYSEFRGEGVRTYILQFKDYMPIAVLHRYVAKKLPEAYKNNYWYTGIVIKDGKSNLLAMVHSDREAKRIYIRIRGEAPLGLWESIRREFFSITSDYAKIPYDEMIALDYGSENTVNYDDLISYLQAGKKHYYHPKLQKDFNVGYLLGFFQTKEQTIDKLKKGVIPLKTNNFSNAGSISPLILNIINNNNPNINTIVNTQFDIDISVEVIVELASEIKGDASYLIAELGKSNEELKDNLSTIVQFADDSKIALNGSELKEKGWGRKLKNVIQSLINSGDQLKHIKDGGEALSTILHKLETLLSHFHFNEAAETIKSFFHLFEK